MNQAAGNPDIHLLSGAYALNALDTAERALFEAHLGECSSCQVEVADFQETAASIASVADGDGGPSAELRSRVLSSIGTVRPLPPVLSPQPSTTAPGPRRRWWHASLLVAAMAALVVGGIWRPWVTESPAVTVGTVMAATDVQRIDQPLKGGGTVTIYRSVSLDRAAVVGTDLPPLGDDKVYELWLQTPDGSLAPAGLMTDGNRRLLQGSARTATAAGITVEPAGGSPAPTTTPIALFAFS